MNLFAQESRDFNAIRASNTDETVLHCLINTQINAIRHAKHPHENKSAHFVAHGYLAHALFESKKTTQRTSLVSACYGRAVMQLAFNCIYLSVFDHAYSYRVRKHSMFNQFKFDITNVFANVGSGTCGCCLQLYQFNKCTQMYNLHTARIYDDMKMMHRYNTIFTTSFLNKWMSGDYCVYESDFCFRCCCCRRRSSTIKLRNTNCNLLSLFALDAL